MKPIVLVFSLLLMGASQSQQGRQVQDTATVEGFVVRAGTTEPIARARVVLTKEGGPPATMTATTDGGGKYSIRNVAPGRYRLSATRDGYVRAEYGQRGPTRSGTPITLGAKQELKDALLAMTPTGAIAGRVYDRYGDPVGNANVQALKYTFQDGRRVLSVVQGARTNDLGEYRLFWMQPGQYVVSAVPSEALRMDGPMPAEMETALRAMPMPGGGVGAIRLGGNVVTTMGGSPAGGDTGETYLPVYYPGTTDAAGAASIDLRPGANYTGVDLTVAETRALRVRGRVVNGVNGQLTGVSVTLVPRGSVGGAQFQRGNSVLPDGTFELRGIAPGSYDLVANLGRQTMVTFGPGGNERVQFFSTVMAPPGAAPPPPLPDRPPANEVRLAARVPLDVGNADVDGVIVSLQPGFNITGRITIEGSKNAENDATRGIRVQLRPEPFIPQLTPLPPTTGSDGMFTLAGVIPGDYRLTVVGVPRNSYVKSMRLGEADLSNLKFTIDGEPRGSMDIVIGTNPGAFDVSVVDDKQNFVAGITVVLVPDAARRQRSELYRTANTDAAGRIHLDGVAPGAYKAFAWEDIESGAWQDPDFIRVYEERGKPVRITEGGRETVELRLIPPSNQ